MAEVEFVIGHKSYRLGCKDGEERLLKRAAALIDAEAQAILAEAGRLPEARLLLLAGLMLADRHSALEDRAATAERELARMRANPPRLEVPVVPADLEQAMAELAARAESLADRVEARLAPAPDTDAG